MAEVQQAQGKFVYEPHEKQKAAHRAFLVDGYDRGTLFWGRQVGKSLWSVEHLKMASAYKQGPYHIVFNTHKHAKKVMWRQYLQMIPEEMIYDKNETDLLVTLNYMKGAFNLPGLGWQAIKHNTEALRSTIQLLGSDYADDDRGLKSNGIIFDEYQDQDPNNFAEVYKYFFTTTQGWACFMGTAKGYNHWWELLEYAKQAKNKRYFYLEATYKDNPAIMPSPEAWYKRERQEAIDRGELDTFEREVELKFTSTAGMVYKWFKRKTHVISQSDGRIPENPTIYVTWDFGWSEGHPTAVNIVEIDNGGKWFVTDEIHEFYKDIDEILPIIKLKLGERRPTGIVCDSARPDLIDRVMKQLPTHFNYPVSVIPAPKRQNSIPDGIQLFGAMIKPKIQLTGEPEPDVYFTDNNKMTIYQMENYKYPEKKEDRNPTDLPVKKDDDHPDGLRYLRLYLKYGLPDKKKSNYKKPTFNSYGMLQN
jgi:hypothetical protein